MTSWSDDADLLATFQAEVEDRLASLSAGLLALEALPRPRDGVVALFRDAHTVKGSARMMGLSSVVAVAHHAEDLLAAVRDGRTMLRPEHVDLLLATCEAIARALPGARHPCGDNELAALANRYDDILVGSSADSNGALRVAVLSPVEPEVAAGAAFTAVPSTVFLPVAPFAEKPPPNPTAAVGAETSQSRTTASGSDMLRIPGGKVHGLIDAFGEVELGARRLVRAIDAARAMHSDQQRWLTSLRVSLKDVALPEAAILALHRLTATGDQIAASSASLVELGQDHADRVALVRDGVLGLAMVPLRRVVAGYPALVRELSVRLGTEVRLVLTGEDVELDKQVLDAVADSLSHLLTNALDHGCGSTQQRIAAGKPGIATVTVAARSAGGTVVIEVTDDGFGVDEEAVLAVAIKQGLLTSESAVTGSALMNILFAPSFSTRTNVTDTSGRGVGLDVVRSAVERVGGNISVRTERGVGTTFSVTLPVTLAVLSCLIVRVGGERYAVPVNSVTETLSLRDVEVHVVGGAPVVVRAGLSMPLLDLAEALGARGARVPGAGCAVVARHGDRLLAWHVDKLESESEMVVKDLGSFLRGGVPGVAGATIDGDGGVVCLLDLRDVGSRQLNAPLSGLAPAAGRPEEKSTKLAPLILVVEDSVGVRELERAVLQRAGYRVETCIDGLEGAARLGGPPVDLVLTDVEMPGMDGFSLTRTVRATVGWERVPVVIMTSLATEEDRRAGLEAGADAYLLKSDFDQDALVSIVRRLLGQ